MRNLAGLNCVGWNTKKETQIVLYQVRNCTDDEVACGAATVAIHRRKKQATRKPLLLLIQVVLIVLLVLATCASVITLQFVHFQTDEQSFSAPVKASGLPSPATADVATKEDALNYFVKEMFELSNIVTMIDEHEDKLAEDVMRFPDYLKCLKNVVQKEITMASLKEAIKIEEKNTQTGKMGSDLAESTSTRKNQRASGMAQFQVATNVRPPLLFGAHSRSEQETPQSRILAPTAKALLELRWASQRGALHDGSA